MTFFRFEIWDCYEAILPTVTGRGFAAQDETNSYLKGVFHETQPFEYEDSLLPSIGTVSLQESGLSTSIIPPEVVHSEVKLVKD